MDQREKRYVPVIVRFDAEGKLRPLEIEFDESHKYPVDKILAGKNRRRPHSRRAPSRLPECRRCR